MGFSNKFIKHIKNQELEYLKFLEFEKTGLVKHALTTRRGGVSKLPYNSLNLKFGIGDSSDNVVKNNQIICNELGIEYDSIVYASQVHGNDVEAISQAPEKILDIDGFITNKPGISLVTHYADCVPLLFLDPVNRVIGNAHSGWKGTVKKIAQNTIKKMIKEYSSNPKDILVGIGPCIGKCCFNVDMPVLQEFKDNFNDYERFCEMRNFKYYIDLVEANKVQLDEIGVDKQNIFVAEICTNCNKEYLYSYRGDNGITGRMGAFIQLI